MGWQPSRFLTDRTEAELYQWVRRDEQYAATLGADVVVELYSESHAAIGWPANTPADPNATKLGESTALAGRSNPRTGDDGRCPLTFTCPTSRTASRGFYPGAVGL